MESNYKMFNKVKKYFDFLFNNHIFVLVTIINCIVITMTGLFAALLSMPFFNFLLCSCLLLLPLIFILFTNYHALKSFEKYPGKIKFISFIINSCIILFYYISFYVLISETIGQVLLVINIHVNYLLIAVRIYKFYRIKYNAQDRYIIFKLIKNYFYTLFKKHLFLLIALINCVVITIIYLAFVLHNVLFLYFLLLGGCILLLPLILILSVNYYALKFFEKYPWKTRAVSFIINFCIILCYYIFAFFSSFGVIAILSFVISLYLTYFLVIAKIYMFYKSKKYINQILFSIALLLFVIIYTIFDNKRMLIEYSIIILLPFFMIFAIKIVSDSVKNYVKK